MKKDADKKIRIKMGKVTGKVLKRSIWQPISRYPQNSGKGAGIGKDCAFFSYGDTDGMVVAVQSFALRSDKAVGYAIVNALNKVAAGQGRPTAVLLSVLLPPGFAEEGLKEIFTHAAAICRSHSLEIINGDAEVSEGVNYPIITAIAVGRPLDRALPPQAIRPGQEIVVSKWIALEGTALIAEACAESLRERYPANLVTAVGAYDRYLSVLPEVSCAIKTGVGAMISTGSGGIFGALWELAEAAGLGLVVDQKSIPIRQETIEVCEHTGINPYGLLCGGMLIMITDDGRRMVKALAEANIPGAVIGKMTAGNDRTVAHNGELRFLVPDVPDEIFKIY